MPSLDFPPQFDSAAFTRAVFDGAWESALAMLTALAQEGLLSAPADAAPCPSATQSPSVRGIANADTTAQERVEEISRQAKVAARATDVEGRTPLLAAAEAGQLECCKILAPFSDLSARDQDRDDALAVSIRHERAGCARFFLSLPDDCGLSWDMALIASVAGASALHDECFAALLPRADARAQETLGMTALMVAAAGGRDDRIRQLLPLSDARQKDGAGKTALMHAASTGCLECIQALLPASDARAVDSRGRTALMQAVISGCADAVGLLLAASDPLAVSDQGWTAYLNAVAYGNAEMVALLSPVSDLKAKVYGRDALMCAAINGRASLFSELLKTCDPHAVSSDGATALTLAMGEGHVGAVAALAPASDLAARDREGRAPFARAVELGLAACADVLLAGASRAQIQAAVEMFGPQEMPRAHALLESEAIQASVEAARSILAAASENSGGSSAQFSPAAASRRRI